MDVTKGTEPSRSVFPNRWVENGTAFLFLWNEFERCRITLGRDFMVRKKKRTTDPGIRFSRKLKLGHLCCVPEFCGFTDQCVKQFGPR